MMKESKHAKIRSQQRGFKAGDAALILEYGIPKKRPGNAIEYRLEKNRIQSLNRVQNKAVLVSQSGEIITVYAIKKK